MINQLFANLILMLFNVTNSFIDAYKINLAIKNQNTAKVIKHGINFAAYACVTGLNIWFWHMSVGLAVLYGVSAFFTRQITFDIPLNLRRKLAWDYVSLDRPPKALMDKIEVRLFGYNGKIPTIIYGVIMIVTILFQLFKF